MSALDLETVAQVSAGRVLNTIVWGLAIAALSWIVLRVFGARNSGTRFAVWFWTLLTIVALPFLARPGSQVLSSSAFLSSPAFSSESPHAQLTISSTVTFSLFMACPPIVAVLISLFAVSLWLVRHLRR